MGPTPRSIARTLPARLAVVTVTVHLAMASVLCAQMALGPEFRVNTYTTGTQRFRSVTGIPGHVFVVTWDSDGQDGSQYGVFAQRYQGPTPLGGEFRVNTYTTGNQRLSRAASDQFNGPYLVVWQSQDQDGDGAGVFAQRYLPWGPPAGGEFRVNTFTPLAQGAPDAVYLTGGAFVVVWQSDGQDGSSYGIFGQRYDGTGAPLGPEFRVNTYTTGPQRAPAVASDSSGNFTVVWEGYAADDQLLGIRGQRYSSAGLPLGGEFRVNTYTTGNQRSPAVDPIFNTPVVVWQSDGQDGSGAGVFGQQYDAAGAPLGPEFRANSYTTSDQSSPDVTFAASGFMVVWQSDLQDGSSTGIYMQKFSSGGPFGTEFRVNTTTTGPQMGPAWGFGGWPSWLSPWTSAQDPDGSLGVYAQAWTDLPVELQDFVVE